MSEQADSAAYQKRCDRVFPKLAGLVDSDVTLDISDQSHVESCLKCQAELVRYRRVLKALHDLRTQVVRPAPGLLAEILDSLGEMGERRATLSIMTGRRAAYTGGIAVAAVAGVTGVVFLAGRSRKNSKAAA